MRFKRHQEVRITKDCKDLVTGGISEFAGHDAIINWVPVPLPGQAADPFYDVFVIDKNFSGSFNESELEER